MTKTAQQIGIEKRTGPVYDSDGNEILDSSSVGRVIRFNDIADENAPILREIKLSIWSGSAHLEFMLSSNGWQGSHDQGMAVQIEQIDPFHGDARVVHRWTRRFGVCCSDQDKKIFLYGNHRPADSADTHDARIQFDISLLKPC